MNKNQKQIIKSSASLLSNHRRNSSLVSTVAFLLASVLLFSPLTALGDKYDDQINALRVQVQGQQGQVSNLQAQQDTLQNKLGIINAQIASATGELELTQLRYDKTAAQIEEAKLQLAQKKELLGESLKAIYQESDITPIEELISSNSFSDFVDRQQYLSTLKDKVQDAISQVSSLKQHLEDQQGQLTQLLAQQKALQYGLSVQRGEANQLLADTQGQESAYQSQIAANKQQITKLQAAQAAEIASRSRTISTGGSGGYPWANSPKDGGADPWGFYWRECTSYAAWKRSAIGRPIPAWGRMGYADAKTWVDWARNSGYTVDHNPEYGAIGVYTGGTFGHVMIVESVQGSQVLVSQYNADMTGHYSESYWSTSSLWFIH